MLNKGQESNRPSPPPKKIWLLFIIGGRGEGIFHNSFYAQLRQNAKRMTKKKILVLAHLIGKASTDAIYEKVVSTAGELR